MLRLVDLKLGEEATVSSVDLAHPVAFRLLEMGLVPGTPVVVHKRAPLGGPLELKVRDYLLSIRQNDARCIHVRRTQT